MKITIYEVIMLNVLCLNQKQIFWKEVSRIELELIVELPSEPIL